jgi:hypothetical protein
MRRTLLSVLLVCSLLIGTGTAMAQQEPPLDPGVPTGDDNAVLRWDEAGLECIRTQLPGPTVVGRSVFILHAAMYNTWALYRPRAVLLIEAPGGRAAILDAERIDEQTAALVGDGEALATSTTTFEQLDGATRRPNARRIRKAVSFAAFTAFPILFPNCSASFADELEHLGYRRDDVSTHALIGRLAALAFVAGRLRDGANQLGDYADTTSYEPVNT